MYLEAFGTAYFSFRTSCKKLKCFQSEDPSRRVTKNMFSATQHVFHEQLSMSFEKNHWCLDAYESLGISKYNTLMNSDDNAIVNVI